jgi:hypothetical protein
LGEGRKSERGGKGERGDAEQGDGHQTPFGCEV